jgi:crotonobetainyl-CoA:carnitine CoA-transferase CaiB-like acyl-CoA transferase
VQHGEALRSLLAPVMKSRTRADWTGGCQRRCARRPVRPVTEALADPQLAAREMLRASRTPRRATSRCPERPGSRTPRAAFERAADSRRAHRFSPRGAGIRRHEIASLRHQARRPEAGRTEVGPHLSA